MARVKTVRVPSVAPDTPKVTTETEKPKAKVKTPAVTINRGATTGMRVMQFQDQLLSSNYKAKLTDEQLLEAMKKEFPNAKGKIFTADLPTRLAILRSVRRLFNAGHHGKQGTVPPQPLPAFDAKGNPIAEVRTRKAKAVPEQPPAPVAKTKPTRRIAA